jgi:SAM-dependent methyltransferase
MGLLRLISKEVTVEAYRTVRHRIWPRGILTGRFHPGFCPICARPTVFLENDRWLRDNYLCIGCRSIPRWRAVVHVLDEEFPNWRQFRIHECSPGGAASAKLAAECAHYEPSQFYPDVPPGQFKGRFRSENLERQTFDDASFDLVITQDVFEHVMHPEPAFAEIARTLKPGGAHLFTVPWYYWKPTLVRAIEQNGSIVHLMAPDYHGNPISASGSLVVTEWGTDFLDHIHRCSGLSTRVRQILDRRQGIDGDFREVFISTKPG